MWSQIFLLDQSERYMNVKDWEKADIWRGSRKKGGVENF